MVFTRDLSQPPFEHILVSIITYLTLPSEATREDVKLNQMDHCAERGQAGICHLGGGKVCERFEDENLSKVKTFVLHSMSRTRRVEAQFLATNCKKIKCTE